MIGNLASLQDAFRRSSLAPSLAISRLSGEAACVRLLWTSMAAYTAVFVAFTLAVFDRFGMMAFDLGIFDQAVWLISRGDTPFVTVRGVHILADHFSPLLYLLAPLYWVWPNPKILLIAQTVALALGALPVYRLATRRTGSYRLGLLFAFVYLLYPSLQWCNAYEFHPETFAVPLFLAAMLFLSERRWKAFAMVLILAALTKETAGFVIAAIGIYTLSIDRVKGVATVIAGISMTIVALFTIKHFNGGAPSAYVWLYRQYGGPTGIATGAVTNPLPILSAAISGPAGLYVSQLMLPLMFLPLAAPESLMIALPSLAANIFSSRENMRAIETHYAAFIVPFLVWGAIVGYERVNRFLGVRARRVLACNVVIWAAAGIATGPFVNRSLFFRHISSTSEVEHRLAADLIPETASVSAQMSLVPHLTHRRQVFLFPNPFVRAIWGGGTDALSQLEGCTLSPGLTNAAIRDAGPAAVDYVVLSPPGGGFPLTKSEYISSSRTLLQSPCYGLVYLGDEVAILKHGSDHMGGLRLLAGKAGMPVKSSTDVDRALDVWLARQPESP